MLKQEEMIEKVRKKSRNDQSIVAAMMYGSFTQHSGDQYSDIEFYIFIRDELLDQFVSSEWIAGIAPFYIHFTNEFGSEVVIFKNLIRGEFHFLPEQKMDLIDSFKYVGYFPDPDSMLIYDSNGKLKLHLDFLKEGAGPDRTTVKNIESVWHNLLNNLLFGMNVLKRGERARALELLWYVQRYLLQLARINEGKTERWVNPTKNLENDIQPETYQKYCPCTTKLAEADLYEAYLKALCLGEALMQQLEQIYGVNVQRDLVAKLEEYFS